MILFFSKGPVNWEDAVQSGRKIHTARRGDCPKVRVGTPLDFVADRFGPSRRTFFSGVCTGRQAVSIEGGRVFVDGAQVPADSFAENGGFSSAAEMLEYYGDGFSGTVIHFSNFLYL